MRASVFVLVAACLVLLNGCLLRAKPKAAKTPPAPKPAAAAVASSPAPPAPISTPQTDVELPPPQPISPEALATIQAPPPPLAEPAPAPRPVRRPALPKPEQPAAPPAEAPAPLPAPAPAEDTPRLQAVVPEEERRRILAELDRRRAEIEGLLHHLNRRRLSSEQRDRLDRVHSFLTVADDYAKRGEMRMADSFSERALILARELVNAR